MSSLEKRRRIRPFRLLEDLQSSLNARTARLEIESNRVKSLRSATFASFSLWQASLDCQIAEILFVYQPSLLLWSVIIILIFFITLEFGMPSWGIVSLSLSLSLSLLSRLFSGVICGVIRWSSESLVHALHSLGCLLVERSFCCSVRSPECSARMARMPRPEMPASAIVFGFPKKLQKVLKDSLTGSDEVADYQTV